MAISTAAAILGAAVIGGGASAISNANATKTAANAATYAADRNAEVNEKIYNQTRTDLAPATATLAPTLTALMGRLGLSAPAGAPGTSMGGPEGAPPTSGYRSTGGAAGAASGSVSGAPQGGYDGAPRPAVQDWNRYLTENPDVQANYDRMMSTPEGQAYFASQGVTTPEQAAQLHATQYAETDPRKVTTTDPGMPDYMNTQRPEGPAAPTFERQPDLAVPTYERQAAGPAPDLASYLDNFEADPGYTFRRDEGIAGVNAGSAVRGKLRSGDGAKALATFNSGLASQEYANFFNRGLAQFDRDRAGYQFDTSRMDNNFTQDRSYGTNLWDVQQGRADDQFSEDRGYGTNLFQYTQGRNDNLFSEDRGFQAGRSDQYTSNLFGLAGIGTGAAAGTAAAGNNFAQNTIANNNARANTTANAAIAGANNMTNLFGTAAQAAGTYYGMRGGRF